ncbi:MAG: DinB family protein [Cyclobacteriaceae bacterium]
MDIASPEYMTPAEGEYHPYYGTYIRLVSGNVLTSLQKQGESFATLLKSVPDEKWNYRYAEGKWSIKELVGHILDGERIFVYRALAIARGEQNPLPGFDENLYVEQGQFEHRMADSFYREFFNIRQSTVDFFRYLHEEDWQKVCDVNGHPMTVRAIAYIIVGHMTHHMSILTERYFD